jgi:hypothetical protein
MERRLLSQPSSCHQQISAIRQRAIVALSMVVGTERFDGPDSINESEKQRIDGRSLSCAFTQFPRSLLFNYNRMQFDQTSWTQVTNRLDSQAVRGEVKDLTDHSLSEQSCYYASCRSAYPQSGRSHGRRRSIWHCPSAIPSTLHALAEFSTQKGRLRAANDSFSLAVH